MQLKRIDNAMLWYDLKVLLNEVGPGGKPDVHVKPKYSFRPFAEVEREYLQIFYRYRNV